MQGQEHCIKDKVKERYAKIALTWNSDCCCLPQECCNDDGGSYDDDSNSSKSERAYEIIIRQVKLILS